MKRTALSAALIAVILTGCGGDNYRDDFEREQAARLAAEQATERERRARETAEQQRDTARRERDTARGERDTARGEVTTAEEERDEARQKLDRFVAFEIVSAIPTTITTEDKGIIAVPSLSHREPALVTATGASFTSTSTGSSRGWFKTTRSGSSQQRRDFAEIFSNVEAPTREDFRDHALGSGLTYDTNGRVLGANNHINIITATHGMLAASPRFPRPSTRRQGELETFTVTDRGPIQSEKDAANTEKARIDALNRNGNPDDNEVFDANNVHYNAYRLTVRNLDRYPERYSIDISGTLQGAQGTFRCAGSTVGGTCTVDISGPNAYVFGQTDAEWQFIPNSATSKVIIADAEYMWFGWWKREPIETTPNAADAIFDFAADYGGAGSLSNVSEATGAATYEGAAIGYYGFYDVEAAEDDRSRSGRFEAKATLNADFDANSLSGSITEFDTEPTWSVTLKSRTIETGAVAAADDTVSWSIRGLPRDGGQWEAQFYSNFESPAATAQPTGVAGAFTAEYGEERRMIGAFGAERN